MFLSLAWNMAIKMRKSALHVVSLRRTIPRQPFASRQGCRNGEAMHVWMTGARQPRMATTCSHHSRGSMSAARASVSGEWLLTPSSKEPYCLPNPSDEQSAVVEALMSGKNVKVDAVAGSGKTTAVLLSASRLPDKRFLLLTYNARLKFESRSKAEAASLTNIEIHTFHSMGSRYYSKCANDDDMQRLLGRNLRARKAFRYDVVIVDEAQDMTPLYCEFLHKVLADNTAAEGAQLMVIGDNRQCIYAYKRADERHLVLAARGVFHSDGAWESLALQTTYRNTGNVVSFVNDACFGFQWLKGIKEPGHPVVYLRGSPFASARWLAKELKNEIRMSELSPEDIFVLSPSIRQGNSSNPTPVNILENALVEAGIPCFSSSSDDEALNDQAIAGKVVFTTYHQSKGRERPAVVCFSFCKKYFAHYGRELDPESFPNILYVGLTRATSRLYLVAEEKAGEQVPFLRTKSLKRLARRNAVKIVEDRKYREAEDGDDEEEEEEVDPRWRSVFSVTDLTRHLPDSTVEKAYSYLSATQLREPEKATQIPHTAAGKNGLLEPVSDINGVALPALYEYKSTGRCSIMQQLREHRAQTAVASELRERAEALWGDISRGSTAAMLEIAAIWQMSQSGFVARPLQVKDWKYLSESSSRSCLEVLETHLGGSEIEYEQELHHMWAHETRMQLLTITGRMDAVTEETAWEIKCVQQLTKEHFLQAALYAWIWMMKMEEEDGVWAARGSRLFRLINIRTGEVWSIDNEIGIAAAADIIIEARFAKDPILTDEEFLAKCREFHDWRRQATSSGGMVVGGAGTAAQQQPSSYFLRGTKQTTTTTRKSAGNKLPFKCTQCSPVRSFGTAKALGRHVHDFHGKGTTSTA